MDQKTQQKDTPARFNWKIIIPSLVLIIILYIVLSHLISTGYFRQREVRYCHFEKTLVNDTLPRYECAILKIASKDLNKVDMERLENLSMTSACSDSIESLPECEGETHHFTKFLLSAFCDEKPCEIDGVVCGAYAITYFSNSTWRQAYEEGMFVEPNLSSNEEALKKLEECDV